MPFLLSLFLSTTAALAAPTLEEARAADNRGDTAEAIRILEVIARHDDGEAACRLADLYVSGRDVMEPRPTEGRRWAKISALRGFAEGQHTYATLLWDGIGGPEQVDEAMTWFRRAAEQGHRPAQKDLGYRYFSGAGGVQEDLAEAERWYTLASADGDSVALRFLAQIRARRGTDAAEVQKAMVEALRAEAERGDVLAPRRLAECLTTGLGVEKDLVEAYKWLLIAEDSAALARLAPNLTVAERTEAERRAVAWRGAQGVPSGSGTPPSPPSSRG